MARPELTHEVLRGYALQMIADVNLDGSLSPIRRDIKHNCYDAILPRLRVLPEEEQRRLLTELYSHAELPKPEAIAEAITRLNMVPFLQPSQEADSEALLEKVRAFEDQFGVYRKSRGLTFVTPDFDIKKSAYRAGRQAPKVAATHVLIRRQDAARARFTNIALGIRSPFSQAFNFLGDKRFWETRVESICAAYVQGQMEGSNNFGLAVEILEEGRVLGDRDDFGRRIILNPPVVSAVIS